MCDHRATFTSKCLDFLWTGTGIEIYLLQDNTRYAFLQMDDRALVYRGADQPDMSVINPESDVWQHIKVSTSRDELMSG